MKDLDDVQVRERGERHLGRVRSARQNVIVRIICTRVLRVTRILVWLDHNRNHSSYQSIGNCLIIASSFRLLIDV